MLNYYQMVKKLDYFHKENRMSMWLDTERLPRRSASEMS